MIQTVKRYIGQNKAFNMLVGKHNNRKREKQLQTEFSELIRDYSEIQIAENTEAKNSNYLWLCWWQGEKAMTPLVRKCYQRICELNTDKNIILITDDNLNEWVQFPDYIIKKFHHGTITKTHMSDLLRCELLRHYGGIWMDITIYPSASVPEQCYAHPVYSCRTKPEAWSFNVSESRWTSFFWVSRKPQNILFCFMSDFWKAYWKTYDTLIEYFLVDFVFALAYDQIPAVKKEIDEIDLNGCGTDCWQLLNEIRVHALYDEKRLQEIQKDGWFQKLSYKGEEHWKNDGGDTFYKHLFL